MALVQVAMEIPNDIAMLIEAGELIRHGGVVRNQAGHIVMHLKEVGLPDAAEGANMARKALAVAKNNKFLLIGIGAAVAIGGAVVCGLVIKQKHDADASLAEETAAFNSAMSKYLSSAKSGNLNENDLDRVIQKIDGMCADSDGKAIKLDLDRGQLEVLVDMLRSYTEKLAEANSISLSEPPSSEDVDGYGNMKLLRHYLGEQQRIIRIA